MEALTEKSPQQYSEHPETDGTNKDSETSLYQTELKTICSKIAEEYLLITVNTKDNTCTYIASQIGKKILSEKMELLKEFYQLCQKEYTLHGEESSNVGDRRKETVSETFHFDSKSEHIKIQSTTLKKKERDKQDKNEDCVDQDDDNFDKIYHSELKKKKKNTKNDKDKQGKNENGIDRDDNISDKESNKKTDHDVAVLGRSSRKRTAPSWTKSYICSNTKKSNQLKKQKIKIISVNAKSEMGNMKISHKDGTKRSKIDGHSDEEKVESFYDDNEISHSDHDYLSTSPTKHGKAYKLQKLEKCKQKNVENSVFVCPYCSKTFVQCRYLSVHMVMIHMTKCSICKICGKMFDTKQNLMNHKTKHQDEKQSNNVIDETEAGEIYGQDQNHEYEMESDDENCVLDNGSHRDQNVMEQDENGTVKVGQEKDVGSKKDVEIFVEKIDLLPTSNSKKLSEIIEESDMKLTKKQVEREGGDNVLSSGNEVKLVKRSPDEKILEHQHHCNVCNAVFKSKSVLQRHLKFCKNDKEEPDKKSDDENRSDVRENYKCDACSKILPTKLSLRAHKNTHSGKKYSCHHCGKKFTLSRSLHLHLKAIHKDSSSICRFCNKIFVSAYNLKQHYYSDHQTIIKRPNNPRKKLYNCSICRKMCHTEGSLQNHKLQHMSGSDLTYNCPHCDKVFSKTIYLSDHLCRIHNEKRSICRICKLFFETKTELRHHLSVHNLKNPNTCNLCGKSFASLSEKLEHKRSHSDKQEYICEFCGKVFGRGFELNIHRRTHSGEKPFHCSICNASFVSKSRLHSHQHVHSTSRPHLCDICGQSFKILPALSKHKRRHKLEKFRCEHCAREFLSSEGLHSHLLQKHVDLIDLSKLNFKYRKCEYCDQIFAQKHSYDRHIISHTGKNPVFCDICGKGYPNVASLNRHKYSHNSVKRFWCEICESGTNSKTKLKKHYNSQKHRSNCEKKDMSVKEKGVRKTGLSELIEIASKEILETRNMSDSRIIQPVDISSNEILVASTTKETDKLESNYNDLENNEQTIDLSNLDIETTECVIISLPENVSMATIGENEIIYDILQVEQQQSV